MAKARAARKAQTEAPQREVSSVDPMVIYHEVSRWKSRCAELLEALREIDEVGHRPTSQIAHEALIRFVHNTKK